MNRLTRGINNSETAFIFRAARLVPLVLFAALTVVLEGCGQIQSDSRAAKDSPQNARVDTNAKIKLEEHLTVVILRGSWHEMGRQYGALLQNEIQRTLDFANRYANAQSDRFFSPDGVPSGMDFMDEFFAGAAESSGLTIAQLIRANGVEVAYANQLNDVLQNGGKCSALVLAPSKTAAGKLVFCRNYDWLPSFAELDKVVCIFQPDNEPTLMAVNFAGCLYLTTGMNSHGLFLELNSGAFAGNENHPERRQNAWMLWQVLRTAPRVKQARLKLEDIPAAANYLIGLADPESAAVYEWAAEKHCATIPLDPAVGCLIFSNHFIQPGWKNLPEAAAGGRISSIARREALLRLAAKLPSQATIDELKQLLSVTAEQGGATWDGTLFQVIAVPAEQRILIHQKGSTLWHEINL